MNALVSNVLTQVFITLIAVSGIYVLTGLTGMFSLGQAAFMAIGSYVSGLLVIRAHVPFALAALLAVAGATLIGYVIGYPVVRLRRDYISLVTLGFGEAIAALLNRMTTLTGGASGLTGIPRLVGLPLAFVSAVLAIALAAFFKTSKYGRQCIALKGDELAAKAMGINVTRVKMIAFLLSVALTSYSGVLYAFYMSHRLRLEKERRLGHYGILWRRQQPDRFHAGRLYPERPAAGTARAAELPLRHLRRAGAADFEL